MREYSFEKLEVWQIARSLVKAIYKLTSQFPSEEQFGLTNQLRRASVSVASNIAESTSRHSAKDKVRFIVVSYGSLMELTSQIILAVDLDFITNDEHIALRPTIEELSNKLNALRNSYLR